MIEQFPRAYGHRGYNVLALSCRVCSPTGWHYWLIRRPDDEIVCTSASLREAREIITEDIEELTASRQ